MPGHLLKMDGSFVDIYCNFITIAVFPLLCQIRDAS